MSSPSQKEADYRLGLLQRFEDMGYHLRLLTYLRGSTIEEEWLSLEKFVLDPTTRPEDTFSGPWRKFWNRKALENPVQDDAEDP